MKIPFIPAVLILSLGGCTVIPEPFDKDQLSKQAKERLSIVTLNQDPVSAPINLYDAMARALKYNLDYKVELMEEALRISESDLSRFDMLPQLVATGGYTGRDNYAGASSRSLLTNTESLEPSTSSEKNSLQSDLSLSWDVLDFGLSYVRSKQKADEALIALEHRRKVANRIIEDVRTSFWRAVSAERMLGKLDGLAQNVEDNLASSRALESRRATAPLTALTYQRELIGIKREIQRLQRELMIAKRQLAALMNLAPSEPFTLALPDRNRKPLKQPFEVDEMVTVALENRSELREVDYRLRINSHELDATILSAFPSFRLFVGANNSSNDFLYNNDWVNWGAQASWNVMNLFRLPEHKKTIAAQDNLLEARGLALTMAVMTQVHVSYARYNHLTKTFNTVQQENAIQKRIMDQIRKGFKADTVSKQSLIREEMKTLITEVKYDIAFADMQNAYANLFAAIGIDDFGPDITGSEPLDKLSSSLEALWAERVTPSGLTLLNGNVK
ncbi:TolC family protein [Pseudocolwellia sp. HL-MZ19]|uniref:TolC family protein n=1 Tax=Pseudocolwellia sp. HL-MZ19 TaxID=3400846 RepID=UPI003CEECF74